MQGACEEEDGLGRGPGSCPAEGSKGKGKARKPYVVSRPREKWSETEHHLFVEALRLYGRSWKSIEQHIGSKTAVQIRSHAQKHFQKLQREQISREDGPSEDIPPPRPKRRPAHPYPRKSMGSESEDLQGWGSGLPALDDQSLSLLKEADAHQVAECASAAAAAAAFAVIRAAGDDVLSKFQNAPPTCFPFYGLTPQALLQLARANPFSPPQLGGTYNQHSFNIYQHPTMHLHPQMLGGQMMHTSHHQPHRKHHHHHHPGKHHASKGTSAPHVHRPLARQANAADQVMDPTVLALTQSLGAQLDSLGDLTGSMPQAGIANSMGVLPGYFPGGSGSGDREQTATSDQLQKRGGTAAARPTRSDGDSAISGEHSEGREGFNHLGDTGATSQDRTAGKVGMPECGPPGPWQAPGPWPMWPMCAALPMQPMWHVIPPHPQYATDDWRQLIMAAATQATQQLAQNTKGPVGAAPPQGCSTGARTSGDKSPSPSAVARMERSLKMQAQRALRQREQRERIVGLSVSGGGSGRRSGSDVKQDEENSPVSGIDETNTNLTVGPSPVSVTTIKPKAAGQIAARGKARNTFSASDPTDGSGEGSREGSREGSGSGEGSNPTGKGTSGGNNGFGNNNSGSGEAVHCSGRGSNNNGNSGSGNGDSGSADHTHRHRKEAAAELANAGQSKAPANAPHSVHGGRLGPKPAEGGGTGSHESGADMAKVSKGNSSGQASGRAPTAIPSLGPSAIGPAVGLPQGHPGLTNWYMNPPPSMHEQLMPSQVQGLMPWPTPMGNMPLDLMQRLLGFYSNPSVPHPHFHASPLIPSTDTTTSGNVTGQGFQPYKGPRSGTAHASRVGPACPSSGALSVASKRAAVHQVHPSMSDIAQVPKKRLHSSLSGGNLAVEALPMRKRSHTSGTISLPGPESSSGGLLSGLRRAPLPTSASKGDVDAGALPERS